jgi:hypothetical protein
MTEGGHSVVYRVEDERLRRPACAKVLNADGLDERATPKNRRTIRRPMRTPPGDDPFPEVPRAAPAFHPIRS